MKKLKYTILLMMFGGMFASCDFLEKEPTTLTLPTYFNSAEEASSFLTGIYAELQQSSFYGENYMYLAGGDDLSHYGGAGRAPATKGLICANATSSDQAVTGLWYTLYNGISRANIFLENIDRVPDIDETTKAQYIAEARFLRAFYYFNLVQCWGDVPFRTSSVNDVTGLDIPRTDKQEIYDFIVKEMSEVSDPETGGLRTAAQLNFLPGHVSKSAAWGILARVYLFRAGEHYRDNRAATEDETTTYFEEARKYAQLVVTNGGHDLADDYWQVFIDLCSNQYNSTGKNESIWEVEFAGNNTSDTKAEGRIGNIIGIVGPNLSTESDVVGSADPGYAYSFIYATPKLYRLYCIEEPMTTIDNLMNLTVNYGTAKENERQTVWDATYKVKTKDERFLWNIAPFEYVEEGGNNTGVTGRRFYEGMLLQKNDENDAVYDTLDTNGFRNLWLEHDNGRSYSYGNNAWEPGADQPMMGDYEYRANNASTFTNNIARVCGKYRREYEADKKDRNFTSINFPILRYSDVLLMLAEAENELNGPDNAYQYLNKVRERAGASPVSGLDKDSFRQMIKDERARELCFEFTRHFDLIRWGEFAERMNELSGYATLNQNTEWTQGPTNVYTYFQVLDAYNYFPIPDAEMSVNKAITENNPGW